MGRPFLMERRNDFWLPQLCYSAMRAKAKRLLRLSGIVWTMARTRRKQKAESISPLAEHEADLELYRAAQAEMRSLLGGAKLPKMDVLKEEGRKLTAKKKQLYGEYQKARRDMQEIVTIKANIDTLMGYTEPGRKQEKER